LLKPDVPSNSDSNLAKEVELGGDKMIESAHTLLSMGCNSSSSSSSSSGDGNSEGTKTPALKDNNSAVKVENT
jgi:hypothetical protein